MKSAFKMTAAIACGLLFGGGAVHLLHAQSKPPAFVVAEIAVKDEKGYDENFQKATQKDILNHGKYLAVGDPPPNRVVILQFPNMDAVKEWREEGAWRTPSAANTPSFASMPRRASPSEFMPGTETS